MFFEVSWPISTLPLGATAPEKVTGSALSRLRLNTITECSLPSANAKLCNRCAPFSSILSFALSGWSHVGFAPAILVVSIVGRIARFTISTA